MTITHVGSSLFYVSQQDGNKIETLPTGIQDGDFLVATVNNQGTNYYCCPTSYGSTMKWNPLPIVYNQINSYQNARATLYRNSGNCTTYVREYKATDSVESWQFGDLDITAGVEIHAFRSSTGKLYLDDFACSGDAGSSFRIFSEYSGAVIVATVSNINSSGQSAPNISGITTIQNGAQRQVYLKDGISGNLNISMGTGNTRLVACIKVIESKKNIKHVDTFHVATTTGTTVLVPEPENLKVGDLMLVSVTGTHYASGDTNVAPPHNQGWVLLNFLDTSDPNDSNHITRHSLYARKVTSLLGSSYWTTNADNFKVIVSGFRAKDGLCSYSYVGVRQQTSSEAISVNMAMNTASGKALVGIVTPTGSGNDLYELKGNSVVFNFNDSDGYKTVTSSPYALYSNMNGGGMVAWAVALISEASSRNANPFFNHNF